MVHGQNVLNISSAITSNSSLLTNLIMFIKQNFLNSHLNVIKCI